VVSWTFVLIAVPLQLGLQSLIEGVPVAGQAAEGRLLLWAAGRHTVVGLVVHGDAQERDNLLMKLVQPLGMDDEMVTLWVDKQGLLDGSHMEGQRRVELGRAAVGNGHGDHVGGP